MIFYRDCTIEETKNQFMYERGGEENRETQEGYI